jgi:hypothetical protein
VTPVSAGKATFFLVQVIRINSGTTRPCKQPVCLVSDRDTVLTAGQNDQHLDDERLFLFYRVVVLVWIMFGLGYLLMIMGYLTSFLRSKRVARLERKLANNIKLTQAKLWNSFTRDVHHLRRVLNEMYVMTLKVNLSLIITS